MTVASKNKGAYMKNKFFGWITLSVAAALALFIPGTARADGPEVQTAVTFYGNISAGVCSNTPPTNATDGSLLVFESLDRGCAPFLGTDGHQLTLSEFRTPRGIARVQCVNGGTVANVHMSRLQPNGVYTVWVAVTAGNIFPPPIAATALGGVAGDAAFVNNFTANANGEGQLTLTQPAGTGTLVPGSIPACLLDAAAFELHVAYHINGQTNGPVPGPPSTWAVEKRFIFPHD